MANIMIATPMYGGVCQGSFMKNMIMLFDVLRVNGHKTLYRKAKL